MSEWIARVMALPVRDPHVEPRPHTVELARFRIRIIPPHERPGSRSLSRRHAVIDAGPVRILCLDSENPHGGVGGSFDSDQCAWLVRELDGARDRYVIVASHDGPGTLANATGAGGPSRVLGPEVASILLAHSTVVAWVSNTMHERSGRRHGSTAHGFWEVPGAAVGRGAPLAGGISLTAETRHLHRAIVMRGALGGESGPTWELTDPLPVVSEAVRPVPADVRR
jgi:hypothetical protein